MKRKSNFVFYLFSSSTLLLASVGTERGPPTSVANVVARTGTGCNEKLVRFNNLQRYRSWRISLVYTI